MRYCNNKRETNQHWKVVFVMVNVCCPLDGNRIFGRWRHISGHTWEVITMTLVRGRKTDPERGGHHLIGGDLGITVQKGDC